LFLAHMMTSEALQLGGPVIRYLTEIVHRQKWREAAHLWHHSEKSFKTFRKG